MTSGLRAGITGYLAGDLQVRVANSVLDLFEFRVISRAVDLRAGGAGGWSGGLDCVIGIRVRNRIRIGITVRMKIRIRIRIRIV